MINRVIEQYKKTCTRKNVKIILMLNKYNYDMLLIDRE